MEDLNSFILQQVIKKRPSMPEGTLKDQKKLKQHFQQLISCVESFSNHQVAVIYNDDNITEFNVYISPDEGPYKGAKVAFNFKLKASYPSTPPRIKCLNTIYHPNIDDEGDICLSLINEWSNQNKDLLDCVQGLLYLLHYPNLDDPLSPYFAPGEDENEFLENVKLTIKGGIFNGVQFECLLL